jgi:hypothetical protein
MVGMAGVSVSLFAEIEFPIIDSMVNHMRRLLVVEAVQYWCFGLICLAMQWRDWATAGVRPDRGDFEGGMLAFRRFYTAIWGVGAVGAAQTAPRAVCEALATMATGQLSALARCAV